MNVFENSSVNVSVIIPTLNEESQISECIRSVAASLPWEIIVVDGGSTDNTIQLAAETSARIFNSAPGRATQQNVGASFATGDLLVFLHADCRLPKDALQQILAVSQSQEGAIFGGFRQRIMGSGWRYRLLEIGNAARVHWLGIPYGDQAIFVSKPLFEAFGGFPDIPIMEDLQLMRDLRKSATPILLPGPLEVNARRWRKHGIVRQTLRNWLLVLAWARGVDPEELGKRYPPCNDAFTKSVESCR